MMKAQTGGKQVVEGAGVSQRGKKFVV